MPGNYLVLEPGEPYRIIAASDEYLRATMTARDQIALILGPIQRLLERADLAAEVRRDLEIVRRNARTLSHHVEDLLEADRHLVAVTTLLTAVSFVVMARADRKALFLRGMPTELVREAKAAAARRGATITTIVAEALARSLGVNSEPQDSADDLDRDIAWYRKNRATLLRRYRGEYVAIVDAKVVDHGREFSALASRVFTRFGNRNIYMPRVQAVEPVARIRSPRRSRP